MRARRNWRLFWLTLPAVVVLVVVGIGLLLLWVLSLFALPAYERGDYDAAGSSYAVQRNLSGVFPEPWKGPFNEGTAHLGGGELDDARELLEIALERVPEEPVDEASGAKDPATPECWVRTNLSLTYEALAEEARASGSLQDAIDLYNQAMDTVGPCTSDGESESQESSEENQEQPQTSQDTQEQRQQEERDATEQQQNGNPSGDPSGGGSSTPEPSGSDPSGGETSEDPRIGELGGRNQSASENAGQWSGGGGWGGGQNW